MEVEVTKKSGCERIEKKLKSEWKMNHVEHQGVTYP
jgi:hypothetical protein